MTRLMNACYFTLIGAALAMAAFAWLVSVGA